MKQIPSDSHFWFELLSFNGSGDILSPQQKPKLSLIISYCNISNAFGKKSHELGKVHHFALPYFLF